MSLKPEMTLYRVMSNFADFYCFLLVWLWTGIDVNIKTGTKPFFNLENIHVVLKLWSSYFLHRVPRIVRRRYTLWLHALVIFRMLVMRLLQLVTHSRFKSLPLLWRQFKWWKLTVAKFVIVLSNTTIRNIRSRIMSWAVFFADKRNKGSDRVAGETPGIVWSTGHSST